MTSTKKFCYLEPDFPKNIFIALVFLKLDENTVLYPLFETFSDLKKLSATLKKLKRHIEKRNPGTDAYGGLVVTLEYDHGFPLKKEYWDPSENLNSNKDIRMMAFLEMLKGPHSFFWTIITPQSYDTKTKTWKLMNWLPIRVTTTDKQIEALIKSSDQSVDEKANNVGMYSIIKVQGFDIEEGKLVKPKSDFETPVANC